jgi:hypothetical protein
MMQWMMKQTEGKFVARFLFLKNNAATLYKTQTRAFSAVL